MKLSFPPDPISQSINGDMISYGFLCRSAVSCLTTGCYLDSDTHQMPLSASTSGTFFVIIPYCPVKLNFIFCSWVRKRFVLQEGGTVCLRDAQYGNNFDHLCLYSVHCFQRLRCVYPDLPKIRWTVPQGHPAIAAYFYHEEIQDSDNSGRRKKTGKVDTL